ncbi:hypothetical protein KY284_018151 [Solanum tuberosum]|nr:hypothetical protein KY284_018151 [Solanum tuberosum]
MEWNVTPNPELSMLVFLECPVKENEDRAKLVDLQKQEGYGARSFPFMDSSRKAQSAPIAHLSTNTEPSRVASELLKHSYFSTSVKLSRCTSGP